MPPLRRGGKSEDQQGQSGSTDDEWRRTACCRGNDGSTDRGARDGDDLACIEEHSGEQNGLVRSVISDVIGRTGGTMLGRMLVAGEIVVQGRRRQDDHKVQAKAPPRAGAHPPVDFDCAH